jgi:hypothetical protein
VCPSGLTTCGANCRDITNDRANCGGCGMACGAGQVCSGGRCVGACAAEQTRCSAGCTNTAFDPNNCGECGFVCGAGFGCSGGACRPLVGVDAGACAPPAILCNGSCIDPRNDNANCGVCARTCGEDRTCAGGVCTQACAPGQTRCGSACTLLDSDSMNCGSCGNACPMGQVCFMSQCTNAPPVRYRRATSTAGLTFTNVCTSPGVQRVLAGADDSSVRVAMPFGFRFWDRDIASGAMMNVTSNGWIAIPPETFASLGGTIPSTSTPNGVIAAYWGDNFNRPGQCIATLGSAPFRRWVMQVDDGAHCCDTAPGVNLNYEIVISETTNTIDFLYGSMAGARSSTVGVENPTGTMGISGCPSATVYSCVPAANSAVRFEPTP